MVMVVCVCVCVCMCVEVIEELLKNGALVKEKNILGWTPLDEALSYGNVDTGEGSPWLVCFGRGCAYC